MLPTLKRFLSFACMASLLTACGPDLKEGVAEAYATLPQDIDFNFHVKPILSDRCYACHGPDARRQQADLRLDTPEGAYASLSSGHGVAIKPGKPAASEMIARINSEDPELVMPTPESNLSLSDYEIAVLTKWVEQGAEYKAHWAFVAPTSPTVPAAGEGWATNDIDRFVAAKLSLENVAPSQEAERPYLIRRAYFDLTGLPPTIADLDKWEAADIPDWYEAMVDELMARPAYGERMANYWMDVARFADSEGYLDDFHHELWPYRDWVIRAYNENLPYDQFLRWQIAGDLLEEPTPDQLLATTFNRTHKQNSEGGIIPEEFRVEYVADRANTVGTAFMGLTVGCARCHDHKYDPLSQKNYYELFGFFNNTVERGDAIFGLNGVQNSMKTDNALSMNAGPTLALPDAETRRIHDYLLHLIEQEEAALTGTLDSASADPLPALRETELKGYIASKTVNHLTFDETPVVEHANGYKLRWNALSQVPGRIGRAVELGPEALTTEGEGSRFERSDPFTVSFWVYTPKFFEEAHVLYNSNTRIQGYRGWDAIIDSNRVHLRLNHAHPYQSIDLRIDEPLRNETWTHFTWSYDGSSDAGGMRVYVDGQLTAPTVLRNHLVRSTRPYGTETGALIYAQYNGLTVGSRFYDEDFGGGRIDELRVLNVEAGDLIARYLYEAPIGEFTLGTDERERREYDDLHRNERSIALQRSLHRLRAREVTTLDTVREVMVMGDDSHVRPTYILNRGVYDEHGAEVSPGVPENLLVWPQGAPRNRLGLARWLLHEDNPLTARVAVNQLWYVMFGRGLVETVEDFGNQGALPSHPDLLDYLAVDFRAHGWDVKRLVKMMVMSSTYRQSSRIREDLSERDPDNYWLARAPRYRRSAEMVRDNALAAADLLNTKVGGASVYPYQPAGLWREVNGHGFSPEYVVDKEEGLYRRSLYTFWKRNSPPPAMLTFDASLRNECQVRRQRSSTPLQALVLLNDPQILEACRVLAANALAATRSEVQATDLIFRRLIGREPTTNEREIMLQYYEGELNYFDDHPFATQEFLATGFHDTDLAAGPTRVAALARVANSVMNTQEGYYKN
ncbi:hypothetical protein LEM8419_01943 [Neolewinella maritima]|uniref:DUF1553 domain-containing protein n=1 Tax=Neolewinella maritima TaxID=1383882 RepID=A0ABM9B132_9BACT|nr:DUF1553 domain-containing protein [Neolewinella maritima]CAH1000904.1 hypothetical protein LEM8419_01943 [Neolewinella maritima]